MIYGSSPYIKKNIVGVTGSTGAANTNRGRVTLSSAVNSIFINNNLVDLLDDPFIVSKPNILGACINYCKNRNKLKYDGDFFIKNKQLKIHDLEPIGPFGLTEWIYFNNIKFSSFHQSMLLDKNGYFGKHEQKTIWKS
jgi:hypothetical protein